MKSHQMEVNLMDENSHLMDRLRQPFPASLHCGSSHWTIWTLVTKQLSGSEWRQSWKTSDLWVSFVAVYQGIWFGALPTACTLYCVSFGLHIHQCPQTLMLPLHISECLSLWVGDLLADPLKVLDPNDRGTLVSQENMKTFNSSVDTEL